MFASASRLASLCENAISYVTAVDARTIRESGEGGSHGLAGGFRVERKGVRRLGSAYVRSRWSVLACVSLS